MTTKLTQEEEKLSRKLLEALHCNTPAMNSVLIHQMTPQEAREKARLLGPHIQAICRKAGLRSRIGRRYLDTLKAAQLIRLKAEEATP